MICHPDATARPRGEVVALDNIISKCVSFVKTNNGVMYDTTWPRPVMTPVAKEEELNVGRALMERGRRLFWFRITKPFEVEANEIGPAELA